MILPSSNTIDSAYATSNTGGSYPRFPAAPRLLDAQTRADLARQRNATRWTAAAWMTGVAFVVLAMLSVDTLVS